MMKKDDLANHDFSQPHLELGRYCHYKGGEYEALGLALHESELYWLVIYRPLYVHEDMPDTWARPYDDFTATVDVEGKTVPRFTKISN